VAFVQPDGRSGRVPPMACKGIDKLRAIVPLTQRR